MVSLGGSLTQIIVPLICMIAFLTTSPNPFGAAVMAWWVGENLMDVAMYIDDARALQLVLLGGHTGAEVEGHDWERILLLTGALHRDHQLAGIVQLLGAALMLGACPLAGEKRLERNVVINNTSSTRSFDMAYPLLT